jgi:hypothetical protein
MPRQISHSSLVINSPRQRKRVLLFTDSRERAYRSRSPPNIIGQPHASVTDTPMRSHLSALPSNPLTSPALTHHCPTRWSLSSLSPSRTSPLPMPTRSGKACANWKDYWRRSVSHHHQPHRAKEMAMTEHLAPHHTRDIRARYQRLRIRILHRR